MMKLNNIFSSNMVFAKGLPILIYGTGCGEGLITFAGQCQKIVSTTEEWFAEFEPMEYGGPYELEFKTNEKSIVLSDIYIGEVYLFAGQSNMQFKMKESTEEISVYKTYDKLRLFSIDKIDNTEFYTPQDGWIKCKKETVGEWSAISYLTATEVIKSKNIVVGVIICYQGASVIESWVPDGIFEKNGIDIPLDKKHIDHTHPNYSKWNKKGFLYSFAFCQVIPFQVSAVVWYQGESDTSLEEAMVYKNELAILIKKWREDFRNSNLPFVIIQISDYREDEAWKNIQKAQWEIQYMLNNVKSVISADVCEKSEIHPPTKSKLSKKVSSALIEFCELIH